MTSSATRTSFRVGFETLAQERQDVELAWRGRPPPWLNGRLFRTGPARFEVGKDAYRHWFDGLAMLHKFELRDGAVRYSNRFLHSQAFLASVKAGHIARDEFGTACRRTFWSRLSGAASTEMTDNGSVNIISYGPGDLVALTETPHPVRFDPRTLEADGEFKWTDDIGSQLTTAHPLWDAERRLIYNFETAFGRRNLYRFTSVAAGSRTRRLVAEIETDQPVWIHSFGMSARYLILAEFPLVVLPLRLLFSGGAFIDNLRWRPERGVKFTIVDKESGDIVRRAETDPCFGFHLVNAFEEDGDLALDLVAYSDAAIVASLSLDRLRRAGVKAMGRLARFRIPLNPGAVTRTILSEAPLEMPRFDERRAGRAYRFVWGAGQAGEDFMDRVTKCDLQTGEAAHWSEAGAYPGEPVFVAAPDGRGEDDGVVLTVVLDANEGRSFLAVLDAATLQEQARAYAPHIIPFGFHGNFFAGAAEAPSAGF
ncbi:carotenoid oxygenase family protein [Methylocapsa palsarum]|uniref:Dioxygenase n=1 Tax=Methylocapsa palsarum TaxID=1612308 RepID=A0A1I3ZB11_9HYPH|nr:carotenoid oxygenase family protein [Methylocapsa palsarum]SFK40891.1 Carotenoid cleavage dioxygenase [Methylocapsa palsarum]